MDNQYEFSAGLLCDDLVVIPPIGRIGHPRLLRMDALEPLRGEPMAKAPITRIFFSPKDSETGDGAALREQSWSG